MDEIGALYLRGAAASGQQMTTGPSRSSTSGARGRGVARGFRVRVLHDAEYRSKLPPSPRLWRTTLRKDATHEPQDEGRHSQRRRRGWPAVRRSCGRARAQPGPRIVTPDRASAGRDLRADARTGHRRDAQGGQGRPQRRGLRPRVRRRPHCRGRRQARALAPSASTSTRSASRKPTRTRRRTASPARSQFRQARPVRGRHPRSHRGDAVPAAEPQRETEADA